MIEIKARMRRIIERLPQYSVVKPRVEDWISQVLASDPQRGVWHASRLGGFCGAELGALCEGLLGDQRGVEQIIRRKLLTEAPGTQGSSEKRAIAMEPIHRMMFHEKHDAMVDVPAMRCLSAARVPRPWMVYAPDDVLLLRNGERWLVDYCSPDEPHFLVDLEPAKSTALVLGGLVAAYNGIKIDRLMLSEMSWKEWDTREHQVGRHAELEELIQDAGEHYWGMVLSGEVSVESCACSDDGKMNATEEVSTSEVSADQRQRCAA